MTYGVECRQICYLFMQEKIIIRGARIHNLKNLDVTLPKNKLIVFTGLSGSGKSSLAFDTIYAEGQRRYMESLSAYARNFLAVKDKPEVDKIEGLSPAIAIDQRAVTHNPRSTVGTLTEIYDFLRLLMANAGRAHCPSCHLPLVSQERHKIVRAVIQRASEVPVLILAPIIKQKKGQHKRLLNKLKESGYRQVRIDGYICSLEEALANELDKNRPHNLEVIVDVYKTANGKAHTVDCQQAANQTDNERILGRLVKDALDLGDGCLIVYDIEKQQDQLYSENLTCPRCGFSLPDLDAGFFSFNSPRGACSACGGLGTRLEIDPDLVIPNKKLTLAEGAIRPWARISGNTQAKQLKLLAELARRHGFDLNTPVEKLTPAQLSLVLYGEQNAKTAVPGVDRSKQRDTYEGVATNLLRRYGESNSTYLRQEIEKYMRIQRCSQCHGLRLKPEVLAVTLQDKHISQLAQMTLIELKDFLRSLKFSRRLRSVVEGLLKEILLRLDLIIDIGLGYLALDRTVASLSGGELQKIRLATQIGSNLTGVLYVLDEPSVGLHERDNKKLIKTLKRLQAMGNTVIVVEHDAAMIGAADWVLDIGPGAGKNGGEIIAQGKPAEIKKNKNSLTGAYLAGRKKIEVKKNSQRGNGKYLEIIGAGEFNLKNINVKIPLGKFVCITGVSGSGKSTLMDNILARALARHFYQAKELPGRHKEIRGLQHINKVVSIDQSPIGRTPRSNPATYTGVFTYIRELWARQPEAKIKGFDAGHFSFNVKGGRCEACQGDGEVKIEMHFLPDVYVECEVCHGKRYNQEALEIYWHDKNIADVLAMTVEEALEFFADEQQIVNKLKILYDVGLGYLELGQPAPTLSGGEAQRIKLATELSRRETGKTLYILDEPTIGLHFEDVNKLLDVLNRLVDKGNTVLVIEHNLDVIKNADWIIDLGPEGGDKGGEVVAAGTPQQVAKVKRSYTGQYLKAVL